MESEVNKNIDQARLFYTIFTISLVVGAGLILIGLDPIQTMIISMVISGILTPITIFILMKICNDPEVLGNYTNGRIINIVGWIAVIISASLVIAMTVTSIFPF